MRWSTLVDVFKNLSKTVSMRTTKSGSCLGRTATAISPFLEYDTVKTVHITSKKVGAA
jgi:hypothetical protein